MSIDHAKLREHAVELQRLLAHYAPLEPEVAMLQRQLAPFLEPILNGTALLPYDRIPGGRQILESKLGQLGDLAAAFWEFSFFARGGDSEEEERFAARVRSDPSFMARMLSPRLTWRERLWSAWVRLTRPTWRR